MYKYRNRRILPTKYIQPQIPTTKKHEVKHSASLLYSIYSKIQFLNKMVSLIPVFLFIILSAGFVSQASVLKNKYCRKFDGMARCVDDPLMVEDEDLWCPYRICAASYIPAEECPINKEEQATHKCTSVTVKDKIHYCVEGRIHKVVKTPVDCEKTSSCTGEVRVCACQAKRPERVVLTPEFDIKPICE